MRPFLFHVFGVDCQTLRAMHVWNDVWIWQRQTRARRDALFVCSRLFYSRSFCSRWRSARAVCSTEKILMRFHWRWVFLLTTILADFTDEVESKSVYKDGIIIRYDKKGHVIGIDITDSMKLFSSSDMMTLQEACVFLGISESTMRRKIRDGKVKFIKRGKDYRFKKADIISLAA